MYPAQQDDLQQIIGLARTGRMAQAAQAVAAARARGASGAVFWAVEGAIACATGRFDAAVPPLQAALRDSPQDITVRANLADALYHTQDHAGALALCTPQAAQADRSLRLARLGGHLAQDAGEFATAVALYRIVVAGDPRDWAAWNNLGNALTEMDDHTGAVQALGRAAALAPDSAPIHLNLARALIEAGDLDQAEPILTALAAALPDEAEVHYARFALLRARGSAEAAHEALARAGALAPTHPLIQLDLGQHAAMLARFDQVEAPLRAALAADPTMAQGWVGLASLLERLNREDELDLLRDTAAGHGIAPGALSFIDALRHKRAHRYDAALAALDAADEDVVDPAQRQHLRGVLLDRLGRADAAFASFAAMNAAFAADISDPRARGAQYRADIAANTALMTPQWAAAWGPPAPALGRPAPIFVLGFPRSGTTLLDTMLMAEPRVRVLEEESLISDLLAELGGVAALPGLTPDQIAAAQARYFARAATLTDLRPDTILVDKHPMHLGHAHVIARLFPDSRFVLALRHPCDVVLSCWLTNFRPNNAMASFLDLNDAADLYEQAFAQWTHACGLLHLPVGTVVYERLVADSAGELAPLFGWLGLDWPDGGADHTAAARARGTVITASYAQVTEPIYTRAAGRWRRYAQPLAPIATRLQPWIAALGYADDAIPARPATHPVAPIPHPHP
ncbi:tetratricopeptide repeat protein [Novosphingobium sp. FSY-8]|uniref:Tetratricopeptide repeat protein n=1 Tax=Novosphingobium ovatum TaxID=1908523 RepID=A0ABW9XEN5_9SPHN|nr:sulfotransferase [Novosphingobium ovatum]NBC36995.1 tetratricopeptide repeat protein [Novosphingobium ovatum]